MAIEWNTWSTHPGYLIADCGELRGEWPTYAPTTLPLTAKTVGTLVCLPPPSGHLDDVLNHSYPTPYVWSERWGYSPSATTGEYRALADGNWTRSLTEAPPGLHVYALWKVASPGDVHPADGDAFSSPRRVHLPSTGTYLSDGINGAYLTTEPDEPTPSAVSAIYHTCWWTYTPAETGSCTIHTELSNTGADTVLSVYTGNSIDNLVEVTSNDDGDYGYTSNLTFTAIGQRTYRVQAGAYSNDSPPSSLLLSVTGPATVGATAPPTYFGGEPLAGGETPSITPLELVPQGMAVGSTGGAYGGRATGHWSDWQPAVERTFTVLPDSGDIGLADGCYIRRVIGGNDFDRAVDQATLEGLVEEQRQILIDPSFVEIPPEGDSGVFNGERRQYEFHSSPGAHRRRLDDGSLVSLIGVELLCDVYGYGHLYGYGWMNVALVQAAVSYRASQWRTDALYDATQDMQPGIDYLPPPGGGLVGTGNTEKAFNYFATHGYTKQQAAGIVGNMIHESGVEPARLQGTGSGVITMPAEAVNSSFGWGIVQWTPAGKMIRPSRAAGVSDTTIASLEYQLDFLNSQLNGQTAIPERNAGNQVKAAQTVEDAAVAFARYFERFAGSDDLSNPEYANRKATAVLVFNTYSGSTGSGGSSSGSGSWTFPLPEGTYTVGTPFGQAGSMWSSGYHTGQDFPCPTGTPAFASAPGTVTVQHPSWAGNLVRISIGNGLEILYAHLSRVDVTDGQQVTAGQQIGLTGAEGNVTGPHLHFEVRQNGDPVDPMPFLTGSSTPGSGSGGVGGSGGTSGGVDYESGYATFLGWDPLEVDVASLGSNYQTGISREIPPVEEFDSPYWVDDVSSFLPTEPFALRIAKADYQPLPGETGTGAQVLDWKSYDEGTTIQTIDLGYSQSGPWTAVPRNGDPPDDEWPTGYLQQLTTTVDFGDDREDLTILLQLSPTGTDPMPVWDQLIPWNFGDPGAPNNPYSLTTRIVAVDGMPRSFEGNDPIATGPTPYPQARFRIPRWRYWIPGPVPHVATEVGDLKIGNSDRPPIIFW